MGSRLPSWTAAASPRLRRHHAEQLGALLLGRERLQVRAVAHVAFPVPRSVVGVFGCVRLHAIISGRCCVLRQCAAARTRTSQGCRGQAPLFPSCADCAQGEAVRQSVASEDEVRWRGAGAGWLGRMLPGRRRAAEALARRRLEREGLLDVPPTIDAPPDLASGA